MGTGNTIRVRKAFVYAGLTLFILVLISAIVLAVELAISLDSVSCSNPSHVDHYINLRKSDLPLGNFSNQAVAADNGICSAAGRSILIAGGNAVDAAIAAELCIGVMDAHSSGLGGGLFITVYNRTTGECTAINGREMAPRHANKTMYAANATESVTGWRSIAIPGDLHGLYTAHKMFGRLPWKQLVQPAIDVADKHPISLPLAHAINVERKLIFDAPSLKEIFVHNDTGLLYTGGELIRRLKLKETLIRLAEADDAIDEFYGNGVTAQNIIEEFSKNGAVVTAQDMRDYRSIVSEALKLSLPERGLDVCAPPPPSGAAVTMSILNILSAFGLNLKGYNLKPDDFTEAKRAPLTYHRIVEAMKFAYATRSRLADPIFYPNATKIAEMMLSDSWAKEIRAKITDHTHPLSYYDNEYDQPIDSGTSHISAIDAEGNACAITTTINLFMGSRRRSTTTGIIWNDGMDDFSQPNRSNAFGYAPSPVNYIDPGKRPLSSMSPLIFIDKKTGDVRLTLGAAGGSHIISSTAYAATRVIWAGENVKQALDASRLHNQLIPNATTYEEYFPQELVEAMEKMGHIMEPHRGTPSVVCAVEQLPPRTRAGGPGPVFAESDFRKPGGFPQGT